MKKFYIALFFTSFSYIAFGQTFSLQVPDSVMASGASSSDYLNVLNQVNNNTDDTLFLKWVRLDQEIPGNWLAGICDNVSCYTDTDSAKFAPIDPNGNSLLKLQFFIQQNAGEGFTEVLVYDTKIGYSSAQIVKFKASTFNVGIDHDKDSEPLISFYPNPVKTDLNLKLERGNYSIQVYNVLGNQLLSRDVFQQEKLRLNIGHLRTGMYVLRIKDQDGRIYTRTFSKE